MLLRKLLVTVILIAVYRLGFLVPIPFLDPAMRMNSIGSDLPENALMGSLSVYMLGIMPYVSAYVLVEILSLCIPFLKKMRSGYLEDRMKLKRIALALALPLAAWQANAIVAGLHEITLQNGTPVLPAANFFEHLIIVCVLVVCFYLTVAICELISRFGIGHGISIIVLSGICARFIEQAPRCFQESGWYDIPMILLVAGVPLVLIAGAYVLLTGRASITCQHERDSAPVDYFQLNLAPSSQVAITFAASCMALPLTLAYFFETDSSLTDMLHPSSLWYSLLSIIFIFGFSYLFSRAFLHPRSRVDKMRAMGWRITDCGSAAHAFLLKKQYMYTLPWTIYLCFLAILPSILIYSANIPFYIGGSSLAVAVAISMDLTCSFKFYKNSIHRPIKIAEFHDIYDATMIHNHLRARGIPCYMRGYYHRLLSYFFGPHIEISLIIDEQNAETVQTLIRDYYGGLGLQQAAAYSYV